MAVKKVRGDWWQVGEAAAPQPQVVPEGQSRGGRRAVGGGGEEEKEADNERVDANV
jgi:hypothetical protein